MRGQSSRRTEIMKFYIIYKIEAIASRRPTESQVKALVKEGILSKTLMKNEDIELYMGMIGYPHSTTR